MSFRPGSQCPGKNPLDEPVGQVRAGVEGFRVFERSHQVNGVPPRSQGLQIIGDRQVGTVLAARGKSAADQLVMGGSREQLESDQVHRRRPVADHADHFGRASTMKHQRIKLGVDLAVIRFGLEVADGHRQNHDVDRVIEDDLLEGIFIVGHGPVLERQELQTLPGNLPSLPKLLDPFSFSLRVGRIEIEPGKSPERLESGTGVDVPDQSAPIEERFGDLGGEPPRGNVGQESDVVDRRDRAAARHHNVHRRPLLF